MFILAARPGKYNRSGDSLDNLKMLDRHFDNYTYMSCFCPQMHKTWPDGEGARGRKGKKVKRWSGKNALVARWVHLLITMAVDVFPLGLGTHETFRSLRGLLKHQRLATLSPLTQLGSNGA